MSSPPEALNRAHVIAEAVQKAGGRALIAGDWVRDRLLGRDSKDLDIEVFGLAAHRLYAILLSLGRVETVGESFQVYKAGDIDVSLPRRESKSGRGHRALEVAGGSVHDRRGGSATARFHDQCDRVGSAHRRIPRSVRRARGSRAPDPARRRCEDVPGRQPARAARDPVRGPVRARAGSGGAPVMPRDPAR